MRDSQPRVESAPCMIHESQVRSRGLRWLFQHEFAELKRLICTNWQISSWCAFRCEWSGKCTNSKNIMILVDEISIYVQYSERSMHDHVWHAHEMHDMCNCNIIVSYYKRNLWSTDEFEIHHSTFRIRERLFTLWYLQWSDFAILILISCRAHKFRIGGGVAAVGSDGLQCGNQEGRRNESHCSYPGLWRGKGEEEVYLGFLGVAPRVGNLFMTISFTLGEEPPFSLGEEF